MEKHWGVCVSGKHFSNKSWRHPGTVNLHKSLGWPILLPKCNSSTAQASTAHLPTRLRQLFDLTPWGRVIWCKHSLCFPRAWGLQLCNCSRVSHYKCEGSLHDPCLMQLCKGHHNLTRSLKVWHGFLDSAFVTPLHWKAFETPQHKEGPLKIM